MHNQTSCNAIFYLNVKPKNIINWNRGSISKKTKKDLQFETKEILYIENVWKLKYCVESKQSGLHVFKFKCL